jgi:hypothetical protein
VLDGIDGRIARLLKAESRFGAELDSLSDAISFGVAPSLIMFLWSLQHIPRLGWFAALAFAICMTLRLARFNAQIDLPAEPRKQAGFLTGVPAPVGAGLAFLPLYLWIALGDPIFRQPEVVGGWMVFRRLPADIQPAYAELEIVASASFGASGTDRFGRHHHGCLGQRALVHTGRDMRPLSGDDPIRPMALCPRHATAGRAFGLNPEHLCQGNFTARHCHGGGLFAGHANLFTAHHHNAGLLTQGGAFGVQLFPQGKEGLGCMQQGAKGEGRAQPNEHIDHAGQNCSAQHRDKPSSLRGAGVSNPLCSAPMPFCSIYVPSRQA